MRYSIASGPDGSMTLWRGGPLDLAPVAVTSQYVLRDDPAVWDVLVEHYGGDQVITVAEMEALSFDVDRKPVEGATTMMLAVDGIVYVAPLVEVPA